VLTSKHHEGWANWPSCSAWNWNSFDAGPHRDLVGELANATRSGSSLRFGLYYSLFEWFHPLFLSDKANHYHTQRYVAEVAMPQLYDLVTRYQPHLLWADGDWDGNSTYWNTTHFLSWLYNDSPVKSEVVVNDRWGSDCSCTHGGYFTCLRWKKDMSLHTHKWEEDYSVMKGSWGYCREYDINKYRNISTIISQLVTAVSRGGNFLLNVGPSYDGRIPPIMEERLLQLGSWLQVNGEAIYNSTFWTHQNDTLHSATVWYTYNSVSKSVFAILLEWPDDYTITLALVKPVPESQVMLLGYGAVEWVVQQDSGHLTVSLPYLPLDSPLKYGWTLKFTSVL
jgi:alpha-L-fucosidase